MITRRRLLGWLAAVPATPVLGIPIQARAVYDPAEVIITIAGVPIEGHAFTNILDDLPRVMAANLGVPQELFVGSALGTLAKRET